MNLLIAPGQRIPDLALPAAPGRQPVELRASGRRAPVLILIRGMDCAQCRALLRDLNRSAEVLAEWDGRILVVAPEPAAEIAELSEEIDPSFTVVSDVDRRLATACGTDDAAVIIADQWGEVVHVQLARESHALLSAEELRDWLRFLAIQCPECQGEAL